MKIYIVEDDANIRDLVVYTLGASGYEAEGFSSAPALDQAMKACPPQLVLLDIMLPGEDGISILRRLRAGEFREIPVIMLTAKGAEYDKVLGLDAGADDYVAKPFGMMELVSRIRAVLRRGTHENTASDVLLTAGPILMDTGRYSITVRQRSVPLTVKEFELLRLLMENPGLVFTREQLLERVWGYRFDGETRTVDVHVRSLRRKLENASAMVETVRGVGYRIGGHV